ncbi:MAG: dihydrofolate reductase family protein [Nocardioides sp.]|uniref:dihydrofolate reductase family protein n=1 Tax=Nocardioides sp. TaxID=35761 RepID=UPI0039E6FD5E
MGDADDADDGGARMRALIGEASWEWPDGPWLRVTMVSSADGAATGSDGLSGSINNEADAAVFSALREGADAVVVGAGTARAEGYGPAGKPLIVIGHALPDSLEGADGVRLVEGGEAEDLRSLVAGLRAEGLDSLLCEGGPSLLGTLLKAGLVDELCLTFTPRIVSGDGRRIVTGAPLDVPLTLTALVEADSTLIGRWLVSSA